MEAIYCRTTSPYTALSYLSSIRDNVCFYLYGADREIVKKEDGIISELFDLIDYVNLLTNVIESYTDFIKKYDSPPCKIHKSIDIISLNITPLNDSNLTSEYIIELTSTFAIALMHNTPYTVFKYIRIGDTINPDYDTDIVWYHPAVLYSPYDGEPFVVFYKSVGLTKPVVEAICTYDRETDKFNAIYRSYRVISEEDFGSTINPIIDHVQDKIEGYKMVAEAAINTASLNSREIFELFTCKGIYEAEYQALEIIRNSLRKDDDASATEPEAKPDLEGDITQPVCLIDNHIDEP